VVQSSSRFSNRYRGQIVEQLQATWGLAKYGRTEVIFGICNSAVLWFGAGHLLFSFLLLSSSKVFQSAFVPGLTSYYSRTSPSPVRWQKS
jgi:hypothetical protein